ncbi:flagellar biosynthesis anti-sigma factor FlgM [Sphingomonas carotinifaciens]|uniref:Negative regulator of flagellin synthesis n=1 Tax=Sphingomonas carotinifaciens TaxID=1166323 RepID=A0A1G7GL49_9SPHN|nr:flagellar biosynthesis anti-sigma factor FlgM [Sphingomonas carotinifaciens]MBB4086569.1 negative regulator of flagellin synthesis FlgM [Sphingomonas carotinifaciens]MWC42920.1 flagellar biosynthesis anti-sigma factor FlgM [Sphingomonas carotinifaciens]SDE88729.1 anti-sigma-28 factor, FlgM family [Sphingomonas carotinifaciens]
MVDAVSSRPISGDAKIIRVGTVAATAPATQASNAGATRMGGADTAALSGLAADLAKSPPVDTDRVATIKRAIEKGEFPILPATIADQMIALKLNWNGQ